MKTHHQSFPPIFSLKIVCGFKLTNIIISLYFQFKFKLIKLKISLSFEKHDLTEKERKNDIIILCNQIKIYFFEQKQKKNNMKY